MVSLLTVSRAHVEKPLLKNSVEQLAYCSLDLLLIMNIINNFLQPLCFFLSRRIFGSQNRLLVRL